MRNSLPFQNLPKKIKNRKQPLTNADEDQKYKQTLLAADEFFSIPP